MDGYLFKVEMGQYELAEPVEMTLHVMAPTPEAAAQVGRKWIKVASDPNDDPDYCRDVIAVTYITNYILTDGGFEEMGVILDISEESG